jgi:hypothetical protein
MDRRHVLSEHLEEAQRFLVVFGLGMMSVGSIAGIIIVALGVSFVQAGTIFITYAAAWLIPTAIAFIPAPFILCYKSRALAEFLLAYVAIALLFAVYELASIFYVGTRPGITDQTTILGNVFSVLANEITTIAALFALGILARMMAPVSTSRERWSWKRLVVLARFFVFFWAILMSFASSVGLAFVASGGTITFTSNGPPFINYAAGWLVVPVIAFPLTPLLLLYYSEGAHEFLIAYGLFAVLFSAFNFASAIYVTVFAPQIALLLNIVNCIVNGLNMIFAFLFMGFMIYVRARIRRPDDGGKEYEMTDFNPTVDAETDRDRTIFERKER